MKSRILEWIIPAILIVGVGVWAIWSFPDKKPVVPPKVIDVVICTLQGAIVVNTHHAGGDYRVRRISHGVDGGQEWFITYSDDRNAFKGFMLVEDPAICIQISDQFEDK